MSPGPENDIDFNKLPEPVYAELVSVFGKERAREIIEKCEYNILGINRELGQELLIRYFRLRQFKSWIVGLARKVFRYVEKASNFIVRHKLIYIPLMIVAVISTLIYILILF